MEEEEENEVTVYREQEVGNDGDEEGEVGKHVDVTG